MSATATAFDAGRMRAKFPAKLNFLFDPHRYKVAWGGRGGAKSWGFARALLILGSQRTLRIMCTREIQKSIADSVHQLLEDQISALRLSGHYEVQKATILGKNGTQFLFAGLRHNPASLKSVEGCDIVWVEEANVVSKSSWNTLVPTVRKPGSEIWVSFNPELDTDEAWVRFVLNTPPGAVVVKIGWKDNPWFPETLRIEREHLLAVDPKAYANVWEGETRSAVEGAIYAAEIAAAEHENRIGNVPRDRTRPVETFWDLGYGDCTAIWFAQALPDGTFRVIDYLEDSGKTIEHYAIQLQQKGYLYGSDWLPHDSVDMIIHSKLGADATRSIEMLLRNAGRHVRIVPKMHVATGINAARTIFSQCWFDREKCADGLQALRHYQYGPITAGGVEARVPLHNWACFHPGTPVLTRYGIRPIIELDQQGEVLAPCGWKRYEGPRITRRNARLVAVKFTDGFTVRCTPEHLFLTDEGWTSAEYLTPALLIQSSLTLRHSISMAASIAFGRCRGTLRGAGRRFIATCGSLLSGRFPRGVTSTTRITTSTTTSFSISNAYPRESTYLGLSQTAKAYQQPRGSRLLSGTIQTQEGSGISATWSESAPGKSGRERTYRVWSAAKSLACWFGKAAIHKSTAPEHVKWLQVESVSPLAETSDVCCIHVPDGECFSLANGAVVHNSHGADAFRSLAYGLKTPTRPPAAPPRAPQRPSPHSWMG